MSDQFFIYEDKLFEEEEDYIIIDLDDKDRNMAEELKYEAGGPKTRKKRKQEKEEQKVADSSIKEISTNGSGSMTTNTVSHETNKSQLDDSHQIKSSGRDTLTMEQIIDGQQPLREFANSNMNKSNIGITFY